MRRKTPCWWFAGARGLLNNLPGDGGLHAAAGVGGGGVVQGCAAQMTSG